MISHRLACRFPATDKRVASLYHSLQFELHAERTPMRRLSTRELLYLQDMCLDAEFRCHQRAVTAHIQGDSATAAREVELKEQYSHLKIAILDDLYGRGNHEPLNASLLQVRTGIREENTVAINDGSLGRSPQPAQKTA